MSVLVICMPSTLRRRAIGRIGRTSRADHPSG
jgi:hypothetical protein